MNRYEITLFETVKKTLIYEVIARGEKEAMRKAKRQYKFENADEEWTTGYFIDDSAKAMLIENNVQVSDDDE
jgi:hypothetical protein